MATGRGGFCLFSQHTRARCGERFLRCSCLPLGGKCKGIEESFVTFQKPETSHMLVRSYYQGFSLIFNLK